MIKICIADDEEYVLKSIRRRIEQSGLDVEIAGTAKNGVEAYELYEKVNPDIYYVDINMPLCSGLDFVERVRTLDKNSITKFIIVSGYDDFAYMKKNKGIPRCSKCGSIIKPDVVLYEEALDQEVVNASIHAIAHADTLIIGGTSLSVYPAASLIDYFSGKHLVVINRDKTPQDEMAELVINRPIGEVFEQIK